MILLVFSIIFAEIFDSISISLRNGFIEEIRFRQVKIFEPGRIDFYKNYSIPIDERIDSIDIIFARTITEKDTINVGKKSINKVIFNRLPKDGYPYFPFLKEVFITFPGVKKDAILESEVRIIRKTPFVNNIAILKTLSKSRNEKKKLFLRIEIPEMEMKIKRNLTLINIDSTLKEGRKIYEIKTDSFYDYPEENYLPPYGEIVPYVLFTTFKWDEIKEYFMNIVESFKGCEQALTLEDIMRFKIVRLNLEDISYQPRKIEEVIKSKVATPFELSLLLKCVYKDEGDFILIPQKYKANFLRNSLDEWFYIFYNPFKTEIDKDFPSIHYFNHIVFEKDNHIINPEEPMYGGNIPYWSKDVEGLKIKEGKTEFFKLKESEVLENILNEDMNLEIQGEGELYVRLILTAKGFYAFSLRCSYSQLDEKMRIESLKQDIISGELVDLKYEDKDDSIIIKGEYKIKNGVVEQDNLIFLEMFIPTFTYNTLNNQLYELFRRDKRENPFNLIMKRKESYNISINIPEGFKPYIYPEVFKNKIDGLVFNDIVKIEKDRILFKEEIMVTSPVLDVKTANSVLKSMKKNFFKKKNIFVFKKFK